MIIVNVRVNSEPHHPFGLQKIDRGDPSDFTATEQSRLVVRIPNGTKRR
jgi:hypothetical protein